VLEYVALGLMIFGALVVFYLVIAIHDIPYELAKHRNHPHQDAIHVAGWVSLLTLHTIWPFLWIWAMTYREDRGYGFGGSGEEVRQLRERVAALEARLSAAPAPAAPRPPPPAAPDDLPGLRGAGGEG
jgi:Protein of unknown function (DUF3302)